MIQLLQILKTEAEERVVRSIDLLLRMEKADEASLPGYINKVLREFHSLKGAARSVGLARLEAYVHLMEDTLKEYRSSGLKPETSVIDSLLKGADLIVPHITSMINNNMAEEPALDLSCNNLDEKTSSAEKDNKIDLSNTIIGSSLIRIEVSRIHSLSGLVGELLSSKAQDQKFYNDILELKTIVSRLKDENEKVMFSDMINHVINEMRETNFNRSLMYDELSATIRELSLLKFDEYRTMFERTVRDTAEEVGKPIDFKIYGGDLKIDKFLLEHIADAIIHLLRNCIGHGIETAEERTSLGKKSIGEISLRLGKIGKNIIIDIGDDGRGIDVEKIKKVILRKNILKTDELAKMSDNEIVSFIFLPGFSTADSVSRISGQGIGMDVVKDVVSSLGGSVEVNSERGKGTNIRLILPVNLSTVHGILIYLGEHPYIIPVSFCQSIRRIHREHIKESGGRKSIPTEYGIIPVFDLSRLAGIDCFDSDRTFFEIVILHMGKDVAAFIVGGLAEKHEFIVKPLPVGIRSSIISGCSILSSGDIAYLVNVQELFTRTVLMMLEIGAVAVPQKAVDKEQELPRIIDKSDKKILLIDDSLTSRTVERNILVSYGYSVEVASDGWEGFEKLTSNQYDLVITDIEMPRMNGFELIRRIKSTSGLQNVPIFIVTTLDSDTDRKKGLEVGADAYIVKTGLGEESLIAMIERYLN